MTKTMRVFVTGATGFIGSAICKELVAAGHKVLGLSRSDAGADALKQQGIEVQRGSLEDHASLVAAARACDAVIHMAFIHDFSDIERNIRVDREAITAMLDALAGTDKPFVGTNGTLQVAGVDFLAPSSEIQAAKRLAVETDRAPAGPGLHGRAANEHLAIDAAVRGIRTSVVRLPPTVHGAGDKGFIPMIIRTARERGAAAYVAEGNNVWPAVHRKDAARLYRLAIEGVPAGTVLHAVAEQGVKWRDIAETIAKGTGLATRSLAPAEAAAHFGWMAGVVRTDNPTSSEATKQLLGWQPTETGLIADMRDHYF